MWPCFSLDKNISKNVLFLGFVFFFFKYPFFTSGKFLKNVELVNQKNWLLNLINLNLHLITFENDDGLIYSLTRLMTEDPGYQEIASILTFKEFFFFIKPSIRIFYSLTNMKWIVCLYLGSSLSLIHVSLKKLIRYFCCVSLFVVVFLCCRVFFLFFCCFSFMRRCVYFSRLNGFKNCHKVWFRALSFKLLAIVKIFYKSKRKSTKNS